MTSSATLPLVIIICVIAWITHTVFHPAETAPDSFVLLSQWDAASLSPWFNHLCSILTYVFTGYLLIELNNRSDILRVRASVLAAFYYLFIAFCPEMYLFSYSTLSVLAFLLSFFFLFSSYQMFDSSVPLFHSFAILSIGSLFFPQLIYFVPIWWIGSSMMQSLNLRSFFASIIGFALPYLLLLAYALYINKIDVFFAPFQSIAIFGGMNIFEETPLPNLYSVAYFLILFVISFVHCLAIDYDNKIRTRITLHFIILVNICLFIFILLQPMYEVPLLILSLPGVSIMTAHFFIRTNSKFSSILLIVAIVAMIALFILRMFPLF
jgi:hypothetical protein